MGRKNANHVPFEIDGHEFDQLKLQVEKNVKVLKEVEKRSNQNMNAVNNIKSDIKRLDDSVVTSVKRHNQLRQELVNLNVATAKGIHERITNENMGLIKRIIAVENFMNLPWYKRLFKKIPNLKASENGSKED